MNQRLTRKYTVLLMEAMDEGILDARAVADMCLSYMSESDVADMCRLNDLKEAIDPDYNNDED